ncbi:MAG: alpha-amylase family glycosyl hydrolase, partial [Cellulosilyticum sp.]|nr:alpha-amylase family glycosyl hydrolase [Cellulosilyticum sp.]
MYEYTIHYYEPDSDYSNRSLWLWYNEVNGSEVSFNGSQYTDKLGRKWATATYKLPTEAINIMVKSTGGWDFKDLERPNNQKDTQTGREMWIVAGDDKIYSQEPEAISTASRCLVLEFYKPEKDYNEWEAYSWTTVSANQHFIFNTKGDKGYATIPVAKGAEGCSFVIPKVASINESDWIKDITADRYVEMPVDQNVIKARVTYGDPEIKVLPYNIGYEADPGKGTLTFYYRDDELFKDGLLETLQKVQVEVNGTVYDMTYDAVNERYTYVMNNVTEGEYTYCYHVTDAAGNTQTYLDAFNTAEKEGKSLAIYKRLEMSVTGSVEPGSINYNENAVLTIDVDYDQTETDVIKQCYVDLSSLGGPEKVEVDKDVMALSISVDQSITTGNKEIPIMVLDKYGETHRGSVTVNVKPRYVDQNDFDWDEAIIYFMETDRFNDGDTSNNEPFAGVDDYDLSDPGKYHGGDFKGVTEKLDYLKGLGVNTIWISPIVENVHHNVYNDGPDASYYGYHGYWALNFEKLNPHLGSIEDLHKLIDEAHARGIKIMLDVVVNHAGYGVKEGDTSSKSGYPTTEDQSNFTDMFRTENVPNSEILTELSGLPDFKTEDPKVREQVINWQANWVENLAKTSNGNSIDYFRIDTVKHVEKATWMALKNKMTEIDPEFKMMGEYWAASADNNFGYLNSGTMDGLIDFGFKDIAKEFVSGNLESAEAALERRNEAITNTAVLSQYLSSHDVDGFLKGINNNLPKYMLAVSLQLTAKGQPIIYYGEELGQTGLNDYPVQTNRYDLDWSIANDENPIFVHYKKLLAARNAHTDVFAKGTRSKIAGSDAEGYLCVKRSYNNEEVVLGFNYGEAKEVTLDMPGVSEVVDLYSGNVYKVVNNQVKVTLPRIEEGGTAIFNIVKRNISNGSSSSSNGSSSSSNGSQSTSSSTGTTTSNTQKESTNTAADKVTVNSIDNKKIELKISTDENTSIEKALDKKEVANIQLESGKAVQISRENVQKAVDMQQSIQFIANHASFVLSDAQLKEVLTDNSQNSLLVAGLAMDSKVINTIKEQLAKEGKMTLVGGEKETIQIVINNGDTIAEFNEPMDVTIDLSDIAEVNAQKLTLVKYEYQADGTYKVIKVGGQYDDKTKTLTAKVSETGNYGVVETDELSVIELVIDNKVFTLNGKNKNNDVAPQIVRGNTMVPLRFIAENLGAEVKYDSKAKKVYINLDGQKLEMTIGQEIKGYEIAPMIEKGRTLVPLRYVSEQLGAHVLWVPSQKAIRIVK